MLSLSFLAVVYGTQGLDCSEDQGTWDYVKYLDEVSAVNPLPREGREMLYNLYKSWGSPRSPRQLQPQNLAKCASGVASVLLHVLPYVDRDDGEAAALELWHSAKDVARHADGSEGWSVNFTLHNAAPKLLGLDPSVDAEICTQPGHPWFFVYTTKPEYASPLLTCAAGMEGSETLLHRWLLRSRCRTESPDDADFFYVPFYSFCFQNLHMKAGSEAEELDKHNIELVKSLEHFDVYRRRQHIFHFAHEFWDFPSWEAHVGRSKIFAIEANPLVDARRYRPYRHCTTCFDSWKDAVVPGHTDLWAMQRLREQSRPIEERRYRFCFHGALRHELYEKTHAGGPFNVSAAETRRQIRAMAGEPDASIGPHITPVLDYYKRVGDCQFCLVPKGVGFTNGRLFEAFFSGCIPVILSDAMIVPFFSFVPWPEFSLKVPMGDVAGAVSRLRSMPSATLKRMQESLHANACWFDYYSNDPTCSPYQGLLRVLQMQRSTPWEIRPAPLHWA
ncbi:unnamed protein product [Cladocopium goreaui]|uniref:Glucuronosyltransferase GUT1 n=1 Tax=Cladocopium goreaui TaxID=2562237 RepID=A0A9P1GHN7_9DINO|nr:unnamed protein product [Cladocopium goreaui]